MNGNRPNAGSLNIDFLKSVGCDTSDVKEYIGDNSQKPQVIVNIEDKNDFNNFVLYDSNSDEEDENKNEQKLDNDPNKYMLFDVETGTTGTTSSIIQLGYIIYDSKFNEIKKVNRFIKNRNVEKRLFLIHGISIDYLNEHGIEFVDVIKEFLLDLYNCDAIIGHNISSDIRHIKSNIHKYCDCYYVEHNELLKIHDPFEGKQIFDTMITGKIIMNSKKNAKLEELYTYLFPDNVMINAHDALYDCEITAKCCLKIMELMPMNNEKPKTKSIINFICEK